MNAKEKLNSLKQQVSGLETLFQRKAELEKELATLNKQLGFNKPRKVKKAKAKKVQNKKPRIHRGLIVNEIQKVLQESNKPLTVDEVVTLVLPKVEGLNAQNCRNSLYTLQARNKNVIRPAKGMFAWSVQVAETPAETPVETVV